MKVPHRPRKQTRDKYRLAIHKVIRDHEDSVQKAHDELQEMARRSPYLRNLLHGILNAMATPESRITTNSEGAVLRTPGPQPKRSPEPPPGLSPQPSQGGHVGHYLHGFFEDSEDEKPPETAAAVVTTGGYHAHVMDGFFEDSDDEMPPGASASTASYKLRL